MRGKRTPRKSEFAARALSGHSRGLRTRTEVYAWRGERDAAFAWLDRASPARWYLSHDYFLAPLRDDPRYQVLLQKLNLNDARSVRAVNAVLTKDEMRSIVRRKEA